MDTIHQSESGLFAQTTAGRPQLTAGPNTTTPASVGRVDLDDGGHAPSQCTSQQGLNGHEARCLCKCIDDCDAALQHALVGLGQVRQRGHCSPWLTQIDEALQTAEREVCMARRLAQSGGTQP